MKWISVSRKQPLHINFAPAKDVKERLRQEWCLRLAQDLYFSSLAPEYQEWLDQGIISDYVGADVDFGEDYGVMMRPDRNSKIC